MLTIFNTYFENAISLKFLPHDGQRFKPILAVGKLSSSLMKSFDDCLGSIGSSTRLAALPGRQDLL